MEILNKEGAVSTPNPREFNGQWFFTNPDTEDFTGMWNGTAYIFPARTTSPLLIMDATPLEMQAIRKQFAFKLAARMFGKSAKYKKLEKDSEGKVNPMFFDQATEYEPFVQQCLSPLPIGEVTTKAKEKKEYPVKTDPKTGKPVIQVLGEDDQSHSFVAEAQQG